ncbi:hypothetical protein [Candidatus Nitrosacidococcus tergens]|uniref:Secreted protein n=1 Tax=Candidatus Nitrosacidococcus tergens TaxID=553981 RepID=A0A7G1Q7X2_9GAMM|nr:hypothetical protein [Candidatus Nitrosacidococcus tergens]CAB1274629.1 conserved exported protein of unknown function [Candidatus Nitrosacidococcus tergens]
MKNIFKTLGFTILLMIKPLFAAMPENGWWWNPSQSGIGYGLEVQNNTVFAALFIYDNNGNPTWYSGAGNITQNPTQNNSSTTIDLQQSTGGSCLGCTYTTPQTNAIGKQLLLTFNADGSTATATVDGIATALQRMNFAYGEGVQLLLGAWTVVSLPVPSSSGEVPNNSGVSNYIVCSSLNQQGGVNCTDIAGDLITISPSASGDGSYQAIIPIPNGSSSIAIQFRFQGLNHLEGVATTVSSDADASTINSALQNAESLARGFRDESINPSLVAAPPSSTQTPPSDDQDNGGFVSQAGSALSGAFNNVKSFFLNTF